MALAVGTNSYISVDDAGDYFADRLDASVWDDATAERKAQALVTATRDIDRRGFLGRKVDTDQVLQFPRAVMTRCGWAGDDAVPQVVLDAVCEQALFRLSLTAYERDRQRQHTLGVVGGSIGNANEYANDALVRQNRGRTPLCPEAIELLRGWTLGAVKIR